MNMTTGTKKAKVAFNKMTLGKSGGHGVATKGATTKGPQMPNPPHAPAQTKGKGSKASPRGKVTHTTNAPGSKGKHMTHGKG